MNKRAKIIADERIFQKISVIAALNCKRFLNCYKNEYKRIRTPAERL